MSKRIVVQITVYDEDTGVVEQSIMDSFSDRSYSFELESLFELLCKRAAALLGMTLN